jgi:hypothetical protein
VQHLLFLQVAHAAKFVSASISSGMMPCCFLSTLDLLVLHGCPHRKHTLLLATLLLLGVAAAGVNAMSDQQQAAMMVPDDSYAGSSTFTRLAAKLRDIFGMDHFLPAHQGRACEHILAKVFVQPSFVVPMNYHFTVRWATQGVSTAELMQSSS